MERSHDHVITLPKARITGHDPVVERAVTGRTLVAIIAAPIAAVLTLIGGLTVMFGQSGAATCTVPAAAAASIAPSATSTPDRTARRSTPSHPLGLSAPAAGSSPALDTEQITNATIIVATGAQLGVPLYGWIVAVATAIQESGLRDLPHGDTAAPDSLGLFQQRSGWGSRAARLDPAGASRLFYLGGAAGQDGLLDIPGWQSMPLTQAAQAVQHSAHSDAYAAHEEAATQLVAHITGLDTETGGGTGGLADVTSCIRPANPAAAQTVAYARQQLGVPYRWGGNGPGDGGFDCSGLTVAAYAAADIHIPRTAQAQYDAGPLLGPDAEPMPGDLVFFGTSPHHVTHVGIYVGDQQMIDAPHTGAVVRVENYRWNDYLAASRPAGRDHGRSVGSH